MLYQARCEAEREWLARIAFPAIYEEEVREERPKLDKHDENEEDDLKLPEGLEEVILKEEEMLEDVPLPGVPIEEAERRRKWIKIPARTRAASRKMHREWGHMNLAVLKKILKAGKAPQDYIDAVDAFQCRDCMVNAPKAPQTTKVGPPKHPYEFNHTVGVDVFDLHDNEGKCWLFLNITDMGTNFQIV